MTTIQTFGRYPTLGEMKKYYAREDMLDFLYDECRLRNIDIAFRRKRWPINPQSKAQLREIIENAIENKIERAYRNSDGPIDNIRLETSDYLSFHSHASIISGEKLTGFDMFFEKDRQGWRRSFEPLIGTIKLLDDFGVCYRIKYSGVRSLHLMISFEAFPKQFKGESILSQRAQIQSMIGNYFVRHCGMETGSGAGVIRLAYSLNEDNGLISLPISSSELFYFRPWEANIHNVTIDKPWHGDIPAGASRNMLKFLREVYNDDEESRKERKISFGLEIAPSERSNYVAKSDEHSMEKWAALLKSDDEIARVEAAWHLMRMSEIVPISILEEGLADENPDVRWYLTEALQKNLDADAMKPAGRMLWDDDQFVRISATDALRLSGENALQTISNSLSDNVVASTEALNDIVYTIQKICPEVESEVWVYSTIGGILQAMRRWRIDNLAVVPALIEALKYNSIRFNAVRVLGAIGAPAAVPALRETLGDKRQSVRVMAAKALGAIGASAAVPALMKALRDESRLVRRNAVEALRKIGTPEAIKAAKKTEEHN